MFVLSEIDIRPGPTGRRSKIAALVYGDWAVHQLIDDPSLWVLTLLPLGLCLPPCWCSFRSEEQACAVASEIALLRNSWSVITQADLTLDLKELLRDIADKHGAVSDAPVAFQALADRDRFGRAVAARPNGYGSAIN